VANEELIDLPTVAQELLLPPALASKITRAIWLPLRGGRTLQPGFDRDYG
jgi:hypothetical protein